MERPFKLTVHPTRLRSLPPGKRARGQVLLLFGLMITALIGFSALAVDVGMALQIKRQYQKVAEVCAVTGAQAFGYSGGDPASAAQSCVASNLPGITPTTSVPPQSGAHSCANDATNCNKFLEVIISQPTPTFFARILNINQLGAYGRAVAGGFQPVDWGMIGLRRDAHSTVSNGGSGATINASACTAGVFDVNGNLTVNGEAAANQGFDGTPSSTAGNFVPGPPCLDPQYPLPTQANLPTFPSGTLWTGNSTATVRSNGSPDYTCPASASDVVVIGSSDGKAQLDINCDNPGTIRITSPRAALILSSNSTDLTVELMPTAVIQNLCTTSSSVNNANCGSPFKGHLKLAPGYYDVLDLSNIAGDIKLKAGMYVISTGLRLGNSTLTTETSGSGASDGVSLIVGETFDVSGNGVVNLVCCAAGMPNGVLLYHIGGCDYPFTPASVGSTPSPFPRWPGTSASWSCQDPAGTPSPSWIKNQVNLQGNNASRTFTGPSGGPTGTIYSPYLCSDTIATSCRSPYPTPSANPTPGTISACVNASGYPTPRFPCNTPQFDCPSGGCVLVGGSGGTTIQGQLIGPDLQFNGNGIVLTYNPNNQNSGFRPYLAE